MNGMEQDLIESVVATLELQAGTVTASELDRWRAGVVTRGWTPEGQVDGCEVLRHAASGCRVDLLIMPAEHDASTDDGASDTATEAGAGGAAMDAGADDANGAATEVGANGADGAVTEATVDNAAMEVGADGATGEGEERRYVFTSARLSGPDDAPFLADADLSDSPPGGTVAWIVARREPADTGAGQGGTDAADTVAASPFQRPAWRAFVPLAALVLATLAAASLLAWAAHTRMQDLLPGNDALA